MSSRFERIYAGNEWGHGYGEGSLPKHNQGYVKFLEGFLVRHAVKTVVEMGCGDWQFSKDICWGGARYQGIDVVPAVVSANQQRHARDGVSFTLYSGDPAELPATDLLIVLERPPLRDFDVFNCAGGQAASTAQVLTQLATTAGAAPPQFSGQARAGDPTCLVADCSKAQRELGWRAKVAWQDGVAEYARWFAAQAQR